MVRKTASEKRLLTAAAELQSLPIHVASTAENPLSYEHAPFSFSLRALLVVTFAASMILAAECAAWWVQFPATCAAWSAIGSLVGLAFGKAEDYAANGAAIGIFAFLFRCIWLAARIET